MHNDHGRSDTRGTAPIYFRYGGTEGGRNRGRQERLLHRRGYVRAMRSKREPHVRVGRALPKMSQELVNGFLGLVDPAHRLSLPGHGYH